MSYRKMLSSSVLLGITVVLSLSYSRVDAQSDTTDIVSGNISRGGYRLLPSTSASTFLRSIIPQATNTYPHRLRLLNTRLPLDSTHDILLRFALLDTNGNALGGLPTMEQWQWYIRFDSPAEWHYSDTLSPTLYDNLWVSRHLRLAICIDASVNNIAHHSMIAAGMGSLYEALSPFDSVTWILARAQPTIALPMMHQRELSNISQYFQQYCHFGGLNRLYYALLWTLHHVRPTAIIVITGSDDQASYDVMATDIIHAAQALGIPIHCVAIGANVDTAPWEVISAYSGGNFYRVYSTDGATVLTDALVEIIRTEQIASSAVVRLPNETLSHIVEGCRIQLDCSSTVRTFTDSLRVPPQQLLASPRQLVALFQRESDSIDSIYAPLIASLASLLKANPTHCIELIGHAYEEGTPTAMRLLSVARLRSVSQSLIAYGVHPTQLRLRAVGSLKPIYPLAESSGEFAINRRVEFRWLDPSLLPYELVVGYTYRESEAIRQVELWEKRGYRAYIETVMLPDGAAFRVKLWGYATEAEAHKAAATIMQRYRMKVSIE